MEGERLGGPCAWANVEGLEGVMRGGATSALAARSQYSCGPISAGIALQSTSPAGFYAATVEGRLVQDQFAPCSAPRGVVPCRFGAPLTTCRAAT